VARRQRYRQCDHAYPDPRADAWLKANRPDCYCLDLQAEDGGTPGQIIDFWHDEPTRNVLAPSLAEWFRDLVIAMEEGRLELA
jgi:cell wall assembly regulator SMI1